MRVSELFPAHAAAEHGPATGKVIVSRSRYIVVRVPNGFMLKSTWENLYNVDGGSRVPEDLHFIAEQGGSDYWSFQGHERASYYSNMFKVDVGPVLDLRLKYKRGQGSSPYIDGDDRPGIVYNGAAGFVVSGKPRMVRALQEHFGSFGAQMGHAGDDENPGLHGRSQWVLWFSNIRKGEQITPKKAAVAEAALPQIREEAHRYRQQFLEAASQIQFSQALQAFKIVEEA